MAYYVAWAVLPRRYELLVDGPARPRRYLLKLLELKLGVDNIKRKVIAVVSPRTNRVYAMYYDPIRDFISKATSRGVIPVLERFRDGVLSVVTAISWGVPIAMRYEDVYGRRVCQPGITARSSVARDIGLLATPESLSRVPERVIFDYRYDVNLCEKTNIQPVPVA